MVFWVITLCRIIRLFRRFGKACCLATYYETLECTHYRTWLNTDQQAPQKFRYGVTSNSCGHLSHASCGSESLLGRLCTEIYVPHDFRFILIIALHPCGWKDLSDSRRHLHLHGVYSIKQKDTPIAYIYTQHCKCVQNVGTFRSDVSFKGARNPTRQTQLHFFFLYFGLAIRFQQRRRCFTSIVTLYADSNVKQY